MRSKKNSRRICQPFDCELGYRVRKKNEAQNYAVNLPGRFWCQAVTRGIGCGLCFLGSFFLLAPLSFFLTCTRRQSSRIYCSASEPLLLFIDLERKGSPSRPPQMRHTFQVSPSLTSGILRRRCWYWAIENWDKLDRKYTHWEAISESILYYP